MTIITESIERLRSFLRAVEADQETFGHIENIAERVDSFSMAAAETQPSWEHRCHAMGAALGYDYGDVDWIMPDTRSHVLETIKPIVEGVFIGAEDGVERLMIHPNGQLTVEAIRNLKNLFVRLKGDVNE